MQTSRPDNLPSMSTHNSDQPKPGNLMTTSESVQGSLESAFCPSSSTLLDSPGLYSQDQFIDPFSMWRLGYSSSHTALERPDGVIEKSSQLVHGCYFVKEKEGLFPVRMGLNLGGAETTACIGGPSQKTSHDNTFRSTESSSFTGSQISQCQAEGCKANLNRAKHYHRRHKICELHSKASTVVVGGLIQRFCQQCSRFHPRCQFDEEKRSCRKSLAEHNRRRRKPQRSPCTRSHGLVGTTALHNDKQKTKGSSGNYAAGLQIVPDMISCTRTTQPSITSAALPSSWPMMLFSNTDKGQAPVLQRTSSDKRSCLEIHYADIAPRGSELSQEGHIIFDKQTESSEYQTGYPCSLRHPHLALEIPRPSLKPGPK